MDGRRSRQQWVGSVVRLVALVVFAAPADAAVTVRSFVGFAYDLASGDLVYTELHREEVQDDGSALLYTEYRDPAGGAFASREVDFSVDPLAPRFEFVDLRTGFAEGMTHEGRDIAVFTTAGEDGERDRRILPRPETLVADAGFDRLVRSAWSRLAAGDETDADFLVPSRLRAVGISVRKIGEDTVDGQPVVTFKMSFRNALFRLLAGSVKVCYHRDGQYLVRYRGLSNIRDADGDPHQVRIEFPPSQRREWLQDSGREPESATTARGD